MRVRKIVPTKRAGNISASDISPAPSFAFYLNYD